jgi:2-amino-4-hydroxy-6-hydroxymethyldihydropteridine diphosphokinase
VDSTEPLASKPSEVVEAAARGELPAWARVTSRRRAHIERVAALLDDWAERLGLQPPERTRWVAAAWLHDALRDAPEEELRADLGDEISDLPSPLLHGPAAARRLEGMADESLLDAIRYHTVGHPRLDRLGRALYLADFLEPGRSFDVGWRAGLAARMPEELDDVLIEVLGARIQHLVEARRPIRPETAAFWSAALADA